MKDKLEQFVLNNRQEFDTGEPGPDLWARIERNMGQEKKFRLQWKQVISRAAIILFLFGTAFLLSEVIHRNDSTLTGAQKINTHKIPELAEAEAYYTSMVKSKMQEMKIYLADHPDVKNELDEEFSELDSLYQSLKSDLNDNIANQEVIEAMIQNYRLKLEILEDILLELKETRKQNDNKRIHYEL